MDFGTTAVTAFISDTGTQIVLNSPAGGAGTVDVTVVTLGGTSATSMADRFSYLAPPTVTNVLVSSTNWTTTFLSYLASLEQPERRRLLDPRGQRVAIGSRCPGGTSTRSKWSSARMWWSISRTCFCPASTTTAYNVSGGTFSYDPTTFTATWTLPQAIGPDKLLLDLNADGSNPIEDSCRQPAGRRMDQSDEHHAVQFEHLSLGQRHGRGRLLVPLQCAARRCQRGRHGGPQ